jgi:hypothetical protein
MSTIHKTPSQNASSKPQDPKLSLERAIAYYSLAGYSPQKIRQLLARTIPNFATLDCAAYSAENLTATFQSIRMRNRDSTKGDPYMQLIMASSTPFNFRRQANVVFERYFPKVAAQTDEKVELREMALWEERWREEARLLRRSEFVDFREKAESIERVLEEYSSQLDREDSKRKVIFNFLESNLNFLCLR